MDRVVDIVLVTCGIVAVAGLIPAVAAMFVLVKYRRSSPAKLRSLAPDVAEILDTAWRRFTVELWTSVRPRIEDLAAREAHVVAVSTVGLTAEQAVLRFDDGSKVLLTAPDPYSISVLKSRVPHVVLVDDCGDKPGVLRFQAGNAPLKVAAEIVRVA